ncbi:prefoldin subunit 5 [Rhizobium cellulosilyticum]|uniref:Prefoldin subunit 5 n=1 Tax=Aliirhizobium cellulosilyticum TaxID=393664 RepID=A0A7W6Y1J7_9HYPH|nr:prefoldin subunit 5 [Rhizobium cellulosilyticum]MBB4412347.1 prefoldin subunit 5 [Rhizobium cellulosilyticum]MBB4446978.1 prefoldin subunit 5 [Rhizobium cellulosilyticum]
MPPKETIIIGDHEKEVIDFLERLRSNKEMLVQLGSENYVLAMTRAKITKKGREVLTSGGPDHSDS